MTYTPKAINKRLMEAITMSGEPKMYNKGFTIMELITVVAMIGILVTIAAPSFQRSIIRAKEASLRSSLFALRDVIDQYYSDQGKYPASLEVLIDKKYIRAIPQDPFTNSIDTWVLILQGGDEVIGIYDVHSGSDLISLYGTPYNEW